MLQMLLYADDLVLLARCPKALQQQLDVLHAFCVATYLRHGSERE